MSCLGDVLRDQRGEAVEDSNGQEIKEGSLVEWDTGQTKVSGSGIPAGICICTYTARYMYMCIYMANECTCVALVVITRVL